MTAALPIFYIKNNRIGGRDMGMPARRRAAALRWRYGQHGPAVRAVLACALKVVPAAQRGAEWHYNWRQIAANNGACAAR